MFLTLTLSPAVDCTLTVAEEMEFGRVHKVVSETRTPGGKGINVAKAIASAGGRVCAGGLVGLDQAEAFEAFLGRAGIRTRFLAVPHPTRVNTMVTDGRRREIKLNRPGFPGLDFDWPALRAYAEGLAAEGSVAVLSGSLPDRFPVDTYARMILLLRGLGKTVVLDASGPSLAAGVEAGPAVIKPNRMELEQIAGRPLAAESEVVDELRRLAQRHEVVIASDGARGAYFAAQGRVWFGRAPPVAPVDTTGAGDALLGRFCARYFPRRELAADVVAQAVAAGTAAVEMRGTPMLSERRIAELAAGVDVRRLDGGEGPDD